LKKSGRNSLFFWLTGDSLNSRLTLEEYQESLLKTPLLPRFF
jgi:hypothetical protein